MNTALRIILGVVIACTLLMSAGCKKESFAGTYQSGDGDLMLTLTKEGTFSMSSRMNPSMTVSGKYEKKDTQISLKADVGEAPISDFKATPDGKSMEGGGVTMVRLGD
ncbi:MAG: hypothetical protein WAO58_04490 [Fimbriimonadaceae bacterium]